MIKNYRYNISILTHDLVKEKNDEKEYIKNTKYNLFAFFLDDNDFENYKFDTLFTFKFKKIPFNEFELSDAENKLMAKYFNSQKTPIEIEKEIKNRIEELKPYNLMLTVEVKENE